MASIDVFADLDNEVQAARQRFREHADPQRAEVAASVGVLLALMRSIGKFKNAAEWQGSREEATLAVLMKALQTVLGMLYLSESGFYDLALALKRNFSELLLQAIAIGHSSDLYVKWKHNRPPFKDVHKLGRALESQAASLGEARMGLARLCLTYWNESSRLDSHQLGSNAVRGVASGRELLFGVRTVKEEAQAKRLRAIRNMCLNLQMVLVTSFKYGEVTEERSEEFPEALQLIALYNGGLRSAEDSQSEEGTI